MEKRCILEFLISWEQCPLLEGAGLGAGRPGSKPQATSDYQSDLGQAARCSISSVTWVSLLPGLCVADLGHLVSTSEPPGSQLGPEPCPPPHCFSPSGREAEKGEARGSSAGAGPDLPGPLFSLLAAPERVWLPERGLGPGLHAQHQIPAGPPLPPC